MPVLPNVTRVFRVDIAQAFGSNTAIRNRIFFQYSGALSTTDATTVLTTIRNAWNTNLAGALVSGQSATSFTLTDLSNPSAPQVVNSTASAGTNAGTALPAGVALVTKFKLARRYRGGHPRVYIVGFTTANVATVETWSAALISAWTADWQAFINACVLAPPAAVGTLIHVNVSYFSGFTNVTFPSGRIRPRPTLRVTPIVDAVIGYSVNPKIASQRRRNQQSP